MCGIAGFWDLSPDRTRGADALAFRVEAMADALAHRGPDDRASWVDESAGLAFGFRRLAIVDLSPTGRQPMASSSGRYTIVFNGEIYNHRELRARLQGEAPPMRGHSDTEVLLAAIEVWGLRTALKRAVGMFALAVWDRRERTLSLARDRLGEKPLYYGLVNKHLLFASELKALRAHPEFLASIDREALALYMRHGYVPAPYSIYRDVHKLLPGTLLQLPAAALRQLPTSLPQPSTYWSAAQVAEHGANHRFAGSYDDAVEHVEELLRRAIADQMVADVPVGAFLSGGIDSSTIVALMQSLSARRIKTFSIGFHEPAYNEANFAKAVAQHLRTDHTEFYVTPEQAQAVIPDLPTIYDEPFADSSQIPTYLLSQLAREQVTVSLSGDGGDELFGGYTRYTATQMLWQIFQHVPGAMRRPLARTIESFPAGAVDASLFWLAPFANRRGAPARVSSKIYRLVEMMKLDSLEALYRSVVSLTGPAELLVLDRGRPRSILCEPERWPRLDNPLEKMMYLDRVSYLPDDILVKVDRAAMAASLETRIPLLDHRLVEFVGRLPVGYKQHAGRSKAILRSILAKYVPPAMTERPKRGFGVPVGSWLRGPLRDWAETLLDPDSLREQGLLDAEMVSQMWQQHVTSRREWQNPLWAVLMFQAWLAQCPETSELAVQAA